MNVHADFSRCSRSSTVWVRTSSSGPTPSWLKAAGLHGHKYAIDATVAETALRQPGPVAVLTSDVDDMSRLCGDRVRLIGI